jgi:uncharacterized protein involved in type VI secretion and phage assembly
VSDLLDILAPSEAEHRTPRGFAGPWYGAYPAIVRDIRDPDSQGRVKVALPWAPDSNDAGYEVWARLSTLMAGNNRGTWFVPDVDDEVLVVFMGGDPRQPVVVGALWNGKDSPPAQMDGSGNNEVKRIRSRNGVQVTLDDTDGRESLVLETPGGDTLTMEDGPGKVELRDSSGNSIVLEASGVTITSSAKVTVNASTVEVSAGMVTVNAGMSKFSGVVQADTVITNAVISSSYTPGAGNVW